MKNGLKIIGLEVEQVRRLNLVRIALDPKNEKPIFVVGNNDEGKSTTLDAFVWALAGGRVPEDIIRRGAEQGEIRVALGDENGASITVRKVFKEGQPPRLIVKTADGLVGNQATLSSIIGAIGLDPVALAMLDAKAQAAKVREALGLDFADLDKQFSDAYARRTDLNRQIREVEAQVAAWQIPPNTPAQEVDVRELMAELENLREQATENGRRRAEHQREVENLDEDTLEVPRRESAIAEMNAQIQVLMRKRDLANEALEGLKLKIDHTAESVAANATELAGLKDPDTAALKTKIEGASAINEAVRAARAKAAREAQGQKAREEAERLSARLDEINAAKTARVAAAGLPEGLEKIGFDPDIGLLYDGFKLADLSTGTRLRVATQMVLAMTEKRTGRPLKVILIKAGNDLDPKNLKIVTEAAAAAGAQVWVEMIRRPDGADGMVVEVSDGEAFCGAERPAEKAAEAPAPATPAADPAGQGKAAAESPKPADPLEDELAAARARLASKAAARAAKKSNLAPDVHQVVKNAMVSAGRGGELFPGG